jgi:hypothetical protein
LIPERKEEAIWRVRMVECLSRGFPVCESEPTRENCHVIRNWELKGKLQNPQIVFLLRDVKLLDTGFVTPYIAIDCRYPFGDDCVQ